MSSADLPLAASAGPDALVPDGPTPARPKPSSLRDKALAALIHFSLSLLATVSLAAAMWFALYPPPYFWIDGGISVLKILVVVDLVLGPALTFVVYNRAKREWKRDLAIIALVQVIAFAYGAYTMARFRPVFAVYIDRSFFAVTWPKVEMATPNLDKPRALHSADWGPTLVVMDLPADAHQRLDLLRRVNPDGTNALPGMGERYLAFSGPVQQKILADSADVETLARGNADIARELARVKAAHPGPLSNYSFQPLVGRDAECMLMIEKASGKPVDCMR